MVPIDLVSWVRQTSYLKNNLGIAGEQTLHVDNQVFVNTLG